LAKKKLQAFINYPTGKFLATTFKFPARGSWYQEGFWGVAKLQKEILMLIVYKNIFS